MKLVIKNNFDTPEKLLEFLILFSRDINKLFQNRDPEEQTNRLETDN